MPAVKTLITEKYQQQLQKQHQSSRSWGTSGHRHLFRFARFMHDYCQHFANGATYLDYGCGKATFRYGLPFTSRNIHFYDPAIPKHAGDPPMCDILSSTDVLEHIEPELLDNVLEHMCKKTKRIAFVYIHLLPAKKLLDDGRNAHLIIESPLWWMNRLSKYFHVKEMNMKKFSGVYFVLIPKRNVQKKLDWVAEEGGKI